MAFNTEMDGVSNLGLDDFKKHIERKMQDCPDYLQQLFWTVDGQQFSVLNYLIDAHQPNNGQDMLAHIDYILEESKEVWIGEPLHQAVVARKTDLAFHLLNKRPKDWFGVGQRDRSGRTLLALVLDSLNLPLLQLILNDSPNVNQTSTASDTTFPHQPIHQAVLLDYAAAINLLAEQGAQLANPVGEMHETPLLLAARCCKVQALEALLDLPVEDLALEEQNLIQEEKLVKSFTAIEELCKHIDKNNNLNAAIKGVAMLLCNGAEPPRNEAMRAILSKNRVLLLKAVHNYLEQKPDLVDAFVNRCHVKESELHNIVYADHSWSSSIRHLLGKPSDAAFIVEGLVSRKYGNQADRYSPVPFISSENKAQDSVDDMKLYAEFVNRYLDAYASQRITNRWSTMRWMITEGRADWQTVSRYAKNHPTSRTSIIVNEMLGIKDKVHHDVDDSGMAPKSAP